MAAMEIFGRTLGPYGTNCYVVIDDGNAATIIDPGLGAAAWVPEQLQDRGATAASIVLTHGHIDHTRDAGELARRYDIPVHIHAEDEEMLAHPERGVMAESLAVFGAADMVDIPTVRHLGASVPIGGHDFEVLHAPGHSPGSCLLTNAELAVVFSGDVLFKGSIGRTDLPGSNPADMDRTLRTVVAQLDPQLVVAPGHGPTTTMRAELLTNPYLSHLRP